MCVWLGGGAECRGPLLAACILIIFHIEEVLPQVPVKRYNMENLSIRYIKSFVMLNRLH